ncbi:MAG: serine/threonine-protein kinase, partial [Chloroflexota bacterium]
MGHPRTIVDSRYQIIERLGVGSMGSVYRATDQLNNKTVALKRVSISNQALQVASRSDSSQPSARQLSLVQEFQILATLRHPHIISVLDFGFDDHQHPYFTMDVMDEAQTIIEVGRKQPVRQKVNLLIQVLKALAYLHQRGIVHRDLKPSNILVTKNHVRVLDFGLSASVQAAQGRAGTVSYMAPEVLQTGKASEVSDLYSLGVLAYELICGQLPFDTQSPQFLMHILRQDPNLTPIPVPLKPIIKQLLEKNPIDRYERASQVIQVLNESIGEVALPDDDAVRESFLQAAQFVGREAELEKLSQALNMAEQGQGSTW